MSNGHPKRYGKDFISMTHPKAVLKNEEGSIIVVVLMMLVLLTIIGTSVTQTSNIELKIVRNDLIHREHFYSAEGSAMQGMQSIENATADDLNDITDNAWITQMNADTEIINNVDLMGQAYWNTVEVHPNGDNVAAYTVTEDTGVWDPSAEDNLHTYTVVGTYTLNNHVNQGQVVIAVGYKKRF